MLRECENLQPSVNRSNSATFLLCFVSCATSIGQTLNTAFFRFLSQALLRGVGETGVKISTSCYRQGIEPLYSGAANQADGGCGRSALPRCVILPLKMSVMYRGQKFTDIKTSMSLFSIGHSSMPRGLSCFLSPWKQPFNLL